MSLIKYLLFVQTIFMVACTQKKEDNPQPIAPQELSVSCDSTQWDTVIYTNLTQIKEKFRLTETCSKAIVRFSKEGVVIIKIDLPTIKGQTVIGQTNNYKIIAYKTMGSGRIYYTINDIYFESHLDHSKYN